MPSVFPLQPSCHVAYCSSDSWSPQSRSLLAGNLCDEYKGKTTIIKREREANIRGMGGSETAQQPDKLLDERDGIGRQHESDGCVTDAVRQCRSFRACPSVNGHSSPFGILFPINEECRFDELFVRFRRWVGRSAKKERRLGAYKSCRNSGYKSKFANGGYKGKHDCMSKTKATEAALFIGENEEILFLAFLGRLFRLCRWSLLLVWCRIELVCDEDDAVVLGALLVNPLIWLEVALDGEHGSLLQLVE